MALTKPRTTQAANPAAAEEEQLTEQGVQATADAAPAEEQKQDTASVTEPAQEEQQAEEATQASESTAVAERREPSAPAVTSQSQFESGMAEQGFDGLTLGGMSFEQIRLPGEGIFVIGQEEQELGKEFECVVQTTRSRYVVRANDDQDAEMFYSYDPKGLVNTEGEDMSEKLQEWKEDGYEKPVIKRYIEAMAIMVNDEEREGMMVMLSIPPASVQKFSGFTAQQQFMKKLLPNQYITRCVVGKKVKGSKNSFFPWTFQNAGPAPELF